MSKQFETQDGEWAKDWKHIVKIFDIIDNLKEEFGELDVSYLHELEQKVLLLNLEKYAWSLQKFIIQKYSDR